MDATTVRVRVDLALAAQNFRPVAIHLLHQAQPIDFANVPSDLRLAMNNVAHESTSWSRIGEQIAVVRDGLNREGPFLWGVHIGARAETLKVAVVCGFAGKPLADDAFKRRYNFTWTIMRSLEQHIRDFEVDPKLIALLDAARSRYVSVANPIVKAAADLAWGMVSTARASGGPQSTFLAVCTSGMDTHLKQRLRGMAYQSAQGGFGRQPMLDGVAWDCQSPEFKASDLYFSRLVGIDDKQFKSSLAL